VIIRTLDNTSKFLRRNLKRGGGEVDPITYPINSVRSPFVNADFEYWLERGKNFANTNPVSEMILRGNIVNTSNTSSQNPAMVFSNGTGTASLAGVGFRLNQSRGIAFWLYKQNKSDSYQGIITKDSISTREWQIIYWNDGSAFQGQLVLSVFNSSPSVIFQIGSALTENTWQHWVFNYDHSTATVTLYKNGVSVGSGVITGTPNSTAQNIVLGAFGDISNTMLGYMSQVILANRTFTVSEINTLYNSGNGYFTI
jgi:hypothetical protein